MEVHFIMSKLTRKQKIEIYNKRKNGYTLPFLSKEYGIRDSIISYLVSLIDYHGVNILRTDQNRLYPKSIKLEMINKVLIQGKSKHSVAIEYGLSSTGMLTNLIKSYKENGCVIVEKKRGRKSTMANKVNQNKEYEDMTPEEKIKYLENKNLYLEAEVEYLKKLDAVVQNKKKQQRKKK